MDPEELNDYIMKYGEGWQVYIMRLTEGLAMLVVLCGLLMFCVELFSQFVLGVAIFSSSSETPLTKWRNNW